MHLYNPTTYKNFPVNYDQIRYVRGGLIQARTPLIFP